MNIVIEEFLDMVLENWEDFNDGGLNENEILLKKGVWNIIENGTRDFTSKEGTSLKMEQTKLCACVRYSNSFSLYFFSLSFSPMSSATLLLLSDLYLQSTFFHFTTSWHFIWERKKKKLQGGDGKIIKL